LKEIFIGSSKEGLDQATQVVTALSDLFMHCPADEPGVLRGQFASEVGGNIYSKATGKWYR
jgi:hypothetical protein